MKSLVRFPRRISRLKFDQITKILGLAKDIFEEENRLIELETGESNDEVLIVGDIHGNLKSLWHLIKLIKTRMSKYVIFLGDYVDRGPFQLECLIIIMCLKILEPKKYFILRGNHETLEMNQQYGFFEKFFQKYFEEQDTGDYGLYHSYHDEHSFTDVLSVYIVIPICVIVNQKFLCLHGGIPDDIEILNKLKGLKPVDIEDDISESIEDGVFQMLWNDPEPDLDGFAKNYRGPGVKFFGEKVFTQFLENYNLEYLIRAHECFPEGFRWFFNNKLLSIFSSTNYRGKLNPNPASYAIIKNNKLRIKLLKLPIN